MSRQKLLTLFIWSSIISISPFHLQGQNPELTDMTADSTLFIGGTSVTLLKKGKVELNTSSVLSTFVLGRKELREASPIVDRLRVSQFTSRLDTYIGMSESGRWDMGMRVEYGRARVDRQALSSPLRVFNGYEEEDKNKSAFENNIDNSFGALTRVGIRFRLKPLPNNERLTLLGGYAVGAIKSERFQQNMGLGSDQLDLSLNYYKPLNPRNFYFLSLAGFYDPKNKVDTTENYTLAATLAFISITLNNRISVFPGATYLVGAEPGTKESGQKGLYWTQLQFSAFLGTQVQVNRRFLLNGNFTLPITTELNSSWDMIIPRSYTIFSFSMRILL